MATGQVGCLGILGGGGGRVLAGAGWLAARSTSYLVDLPLCGIITTPKCETVMPKHQ